MRPNPNVSNRLSDATIDDAEQSSRRPSVIERKLGRSGGGDRKAAVPVQNPAGSWKGQRYSRLSFLGDIPGTGGSSSGADGDVRGRLGSIFRRRSTQHHFPDLPMEPPPPPLPPARGDDPFLLLKKNEKTKEKDKEDAAAAGRRGSTSSSASAGTGTNRSGTGRLASILNATGGADAAIANNAELAQLLRGTQLSGSTAHFFRLLLHFRVDLPLEYWDHEMVQTQGALYGRATYAEAETALKNLAGAVSNTTTPGATLTTAALDLRHPKTHKDNGNVSVTSRATARPSSPPRRNMPPPETARLLTGKAAAKLEMEREWEQQLSESPSPRKRRGAGSPHRPGTTGGSRAARCHSPHKDVDGLHDQSNGPSLSGTLSTQNIAHSLPVERLLSLLPPSFVVESNVALEEMDETDFLTGLETYIQYKLQKVNDRLGVFIRRREDRFNMEYNTAAEPVPIVQKKKKQRRTVVAVDDSAEARSLLEAGLSVAPSLPASSNSFEDSTDDEADEEGEGELEESGPATETWEEKMKRILRQRRLKRKLKKEHDLNDEEWLNSSFASPSVDLNPTVLSNYTSLSASPSASVCAPGTGRNPFGGGAEELGGPRMVAPLIRTSSMYSSVGNSSIATRGPLPSIGGHSPSLMNTPRQQPSRMAVPPLPILDPLVDHLPQMRHLHRLLRLIALQPDRANEIIQRFYQKIEVMLYKKYKQAACNAQLGNDSSLNSSSTGSPIQERRMSNAGSRGRRPSNLGEGLNELSSLHDIPLGPGSARSSRYNSVKKRTSITANLGVSAQPSSRRYTSVRPTTPGGAR